MNGTQINWNGIFLKCVCATGICEYALNHYWFSIKIFLSALLKYYGLKKSSNIYFLFISAFDGILSFIFLSNFGSEFTKKISLNADKKRSTNRCTSLNNLEYLPRTHIHTHTMFCTKWNGIGCNDIRSTTVNAAARTNDEAILYHKQNT